MLRPYVSSVAEKLELVRGGSGCIGLSFVSAGTIEPRHRDADQPEINRELRPVMDQVVEAHAADARDARHRENFLAAG